MMWQYDVRTKRLVGSDRSDLTTDITIEIGMKKIRKGAIVARNYGLMN